ncbi:hypothetical protein ACTHOQ_13960 [Solibacillus silvestris]|uniref:hypothetical protein n=1 Tax=Solibacillus silvestris TaxID=76853 RepID=UPI003F7ED170
MKIMDVAIRWKQELEEMSLTDLYFLRDYSTFVQSENKYVRKMGEMILERIDIIEKVA